MEIKVREGNSFYTQKLRQGICTSSIRNYYAGNVKIISVGSLGSIRRRESIIQLIFK